MFRLDSEKAGKEKERQAVWVSRQSLRLLTPPWEVPYLDGGRAKEREREREREERERREEMEVEREVCQLSIGMGVLEIEALEREAEKKEERAKDGEEKGSHENNPGSPVQPAPPVLGPSMALGESDDEDDDDEDGEDEEEEAPERGRPVRLTNHTCE